MTSQQPALTYVVDASVGAKWLVNEEDSDKANVLRDALGAPDTKLHVPQLFFVEIANILWKAVRRGRIDSDDASEAMAQVTQFGLVAHDMDELAAQALTVALAHEISAYDAGYVALAAQLTLPLITADDRLQRKLKVDIDVRLLRELTF